MSKKPKQKQTEWNVQGKQIADTSVPYYQENLTRINDYLANPQASMDDYLSKYYSNTAAQSDFLRNYNRAMGGTTAQNYAATGGGYDTSNQRQYDDMQRYQNDLASRLQDYGVQSAYGMANNDYANMLAANNAYYNAYGLGKAYSDVDQYNYLRKQYNSFGNQLMGSLGAVGTAVGSLFSPAGAAIGGALGNAIGGTFGLDDSAFSGLTGTGSARGTGSVNTAGQYTNQWSGLQDVLQKNTLFSNAQKALQKNMNNQNINTGN